MNTRADQTFYSSTIDKAIGFAARKHEGQRRKIGDVPYISHPIGVAMILMQMGCPEVVIVAALLHDTVEDTDTTLQEISNVFGQEVADIVAGCTELPREKYKWEERKLDMIEKLRFAPLEVKLLAAADKYHNLQHISKSKHKAGAAIWKKFGRGPQLQAWYYRSMLDSILANLPDSSAQYPVFGELSAVVERLFAGIASQAPQS